MKPRNDIQDTFNNGGCWYSEEETKEIVDDIKKYNPYYCLYCREFSIMDKYKEFICYLCGKAVECMSYDRDERKKWNVETRRKLLILL